jgi:uracil-DNA glycosylase family 4
MKNYVPGQGNANAAIMFIGEAPGADEDQSGIPFTGPSGNILWEICRELGLYRGDVYTTNVVKYRPPQNDLSRLHEIEVDFEEQTSQLWDEIKAINPNIIVTLGKTSTKVVTGKDGILKWRGSCIKACAFDYKVIPTIHPAALLHAERWSKEEEVKGALKYSYRHIIKLDIAKAIKESETRLYQPPERIVEIARDSVSLQRFLDTYKDKDIVSVDIEVEKAIPFCVGLAFNEWHAISVPLLDIWSVFKGEEGIADHQIAEMWIQLAELLDSGIKVIGQNFKFDQGQLLQCCGMRIKNFHCDTSLLSACIHPEFPKALDFNTSIYTNVPYYKEEGKSFNWKKSPIKQILHYNGLDACVTFEVYIEMMKEAREMKIPGFLDWADSFCLDYQRQLHHFYFDMERVGFKTDADRQKQLVAINDIEIKKLQIELNELCGFELNVQSPKQVSMLLYDEMKLPWRKGASEDVLVALQANTKKISEKHKRIIELILSLRRYKLTATKYFGAKVDYDGRMKTIYTIAGTETGRSSTKILKPPVRPIKMGIPFQTITKHGDIGVEIREMFVADEGYVIVETDMSQAEARIVALLANDTKLLSLFAAKADIHTLTTSWIFGIERQLVTKELRFIGKTTRHAGNYGMKKRRLAEIVNTDSKKFKIDIQSFSEWRAGLVLDKFHAYSPNIRSVFHQGVIEALQNNKRTLVNPYGRQRQFFDRWGEDLFKEAFCQIPQSTVPDHVRHAGIGAKKIFAKEHIDARFILEGHDSLIGLVRETDVDSYVEIMHQQIEVPIDFSRCTMKRGSLVIPAESKVGYNYRDASESNPDGLRDYKVVEKVSA